jgi:hypothetical protein
MCKWLIINYLYCEIEIFQYLCIKIDIYGIYNFKRATAQSPYERQKN